MSDVARALLLPDLVQPTDGALKTLVLYWDHLVVPDYTERIVPADGAWLGDFETPEPVSETFVALADLGFLRREVLRVEVPRPNDHALGLAGTVAALFHYGSRIGDDDESTDSKYGRVAFSEWASDLYLLRLRTSLERAAAEHLAPLGHSELSAVGALLGSGDGALPTREAALVSASVEAFSIDPATPVEELARFRDRHKAALGRLRASLTDLGDRIADDGPPGQHVWAARDTFQNRVVPALGALETALAESRIRFVVKSLVGAASLAAGPVAPVHTTISGLTLASETINYRFSRATLAEQHPFAYLHLLRSSFDAGPQHLQPVLIRGLTEPPADLIRRAMRSPRLAAAIRSSLALSPDPNLVYPEW